MPNSIDFRADQIQTKQIIVTGSGAGTTKLLIYGIEAQGSPVNEGEIDTNVFPQDGIGGDVFLYVSGALNAKGSATVRGTSVFGGDLVVSGSLYNGLVTGSGGTYSHAEGENTLASGDFSHAEGYNTIASNLYDHAEGRDTVADGKWSHAEGEGSRTDGNYSHAEGRDTVADGRSSHAEGYGSRTDGNYGHAEGYNTLTDNLYAHAEGYLTTGSGQASHAEGYNTIAFGTGSHASGYGTIASGSVDGAALSYTSILQTATGRFNARGNTTSLFVVGNGTGDADVSRKDLFSVDSINQEGIVKINGGISYKVGYLYYVPLSSIDYILTLNDYLVIVNVTDGGPFNINLPASATTPIGTTYTIRRFDGSAHPYNTVVNIYPDIGDAIIDSAGTQYTAAPLIIAGSGGRGGCVTLTYIGNYYDSTFGTYNTWMTTSELDL